VKKLIKKSQESDGNLYRGFRLDVMWAKVSIFASIVENFPIVFIRHKIQLFQILTLCLKALLQALKPHEHNTAQI
jgi:hypothetical protein